GSYTMPVMKRFGPHRNFAVAVEAATSTGGPIMTPIMGAAAFLMIEFAGVPYWDIANAALIPAILYFSGIWIMTHFEAQKQGLVGLSEDQMPEVKVVLKKLHLLFPVVFIVYIV